VWVVDASETLILGAAIHALIFIERHGQFSFCAASSRAHRNASPAIGLRGAFDNPGEIVVVKRTDEFRQEGHQVTSQLNFRIQLSDASR
jgi:hypothetical protein